MSQLSFFPRRTVHLDFHTGPHIPDVGRDFDARTFAQTFHEARVESVTVFAKCHHGHLYYNTAHPARHPTLPLSLDLLGEQIESLRSVGIRAPIYLSVQCDEYAANQHPEWLAITPDLKQVKMMSDSPFIAGWQILDMASPYQDYLADQLAEVLKKFSPVDGIFMDMCWDQISCSKWAIDGMRRAGLDPSTEKDRALFARTTAHRYMARYKKMIDEAPRGPFSTGVWFNSRPKTNLAEEKQFVDHIEVEALPTGGWGYAYFPYVSRFVRPLNMSTLSHTGRFHLSWGDNAALKPAAALKYETCQILSQGLANGIGDLLHPRGVPHPQTYRLIGDAYRHIERCEPFVEGAVHLKEVALIVDPDLGDNPGPSGLGAVRMLQQLRLQFDVLPPGSSLEGYALAIIPEATTIDAALAGTLQRFIDGGGAALFVGEAALSADGQPALDGMGFESAGQSPVSHVFLRGTAEIDPALGRFDTVMYERGFRMKPTAGARVLCDIVEPYFERTQEHFSGHSYTPPDRKSAYAAAIQSGRIVTVAVPIFRAFAKFGNVPYRQLVGECIRQLLPRPLIRAGGPVHLEATVLRRDERTIVHLISFLPSRLGDGLDLVLDPFPLVDVPVEIQLERAPKRVSLQPHGAELNFDFTEGYLRTKVTISDGHGMIVID